MISLGTPTDDGGATLTAEEATWLRALLSRIDVAESIQQLDLRYQARPGERAEEWNGYVRHMRSVATDHLMRTARVAVGLHVCAGIPQSREDIGLLKRADADGVRHGAIMARMAVIRLGVPPTPYGSSQRDMVPPYLPEGRANIAEKVRKGPAFVVNPYVVTPAQFAPFDREG